MACLFLWGLYGLLDPVACWTISHAGSYGLLDPIACWILWLAGSYDQIDAPPLLLNQIDAEPNCCRLLGTFFVTLVQLRICHSLAVTLAPAHMRTGLRARNNLQCVFCVMHAQRFALDFVRSCIVSKGKRCQNRVFVRRAAMCCVVMI